MSKVDRIEVSHLLAIVDTPETPVHFIGPNGVQFAPLELFMNACIMTDLEQYNQYKAIMRHLTNLRANADTQDAP